MIISDFEGNPFFVKEARRKGGFQFEITLMKARGLLIEPKQRLPYPAYPVRSGTASAAMSIGDVLSVLSSLSGQ